MRRGLHAQPAAANHGGRAHRQQRRHPDAHHVRRQLLRLQATCHTVAGSMPYGCRLPGMRLQVRRHEPRHCLGAAGRLRHRQHGQSAPLAVPDLGSCTFLRARLVAPGGSRHLGREDGPLSANHCLRCSSHLTPKSPISLRLTPLGTASTGQGEAMVFEA